MTIDIITGLDFTFNTLYTAIFRQISLYFSCTKHFTFTLLFLYLAAEKHWNSAASFCYAFVYLLFDKILFAFQGGTFTSGLQGVSGEKFFAAVSDQARGFSNRCKRNPKERRAQPQGVEKTSTVQAGKKVVCSECI